MRIFLLLVFIYLTNSALAKDPQVEIKDGDIYYYKEEIFKEGEITKPFYFIRHAQTDANKYKVTYSGTDLPINDEGIKQATEAAKILKNKNIKIIIASPLLRTKQTAEIINKELNVPIVYHEGLIEGDYGAPSGTKTNKENSYKQKWLHGKNIDKVESLYNFQSRIHNTIKEIVNKYENCLIVGHGLYFINLSILLNKEYFRTENASPLYIIPTMNSKEPYKIIPIID